MPDVGDLAKIGGILQSIEQRNKEFLDKCSDTKLLAIRDIVEAEKICRTLAIEALDDSLIGLSKGLSCASKIIDLKSALHSHGLTEEMVSEISKLRSAFMHELVRPTVKGYLTNQGQPLTKVETLYAGAQRLDRLLEVIRFLNRVQEV